jgi:2-iminoacetate synthase
VTMAPVAVELRSGGLVEGTAAADLAGCDLQALRRQSEASGSAEIASALRRARTPRLEDFAALISPAAGERLEELAQAARRVRLARFGRAVRLFAPLYVSNECVSTCTYCGFSAENEIRRRTLSVQEVAAEAAELHSRGLRHVLLVSGEHARIVNRDYLSECVRVAAEVLSEVSLEVQVWDTETYRQFVEAGCDGVVVYQETYDPDVYASVHLKGKKRNYAWRLAALDRAAQGGVRKLGAGVLLGLNADWRFEAIALVAHVRALMRRWWRCEVSVALPRLRPAAGGYSPVRAVADRELVQLLCALRIALPDVGISLSTREAPALREALVPLGVTTISAGSHTEPGGYSSASDAEPQFEISDTRAPAEVAAALRASGWDPVWKDWQRT